MFQEQIDIAQCSISLLINQINGDILDYASIQSYQFSYRVTLFLNTRNKRNRINFAENLNVKHVQIDEQRIVQLLVNILNNTLIFTQKGGYIGLQIQEGDHFALFLKFSIMQMAQKNQHQVELQIAYMILLNLELY
ncbi:unnamed protein product [Paramecium pentaurelia]|uniref:Uncharacterized protein n=1 Tax=Paramecium pentaurelia TaxID=43138 RepID=A0A8S1U556_9CILI|nr:unnamed protein product [Paramecium pentaurelia]